MAALLKAVDAVRDLEEFTIVAASSVANGDALSARQAEALALASEELLSSPEILKCVGLRFALIVSMCPARPERLLSRALLLHSIDIRTCRCAGRGRWRGGTRATACGWTATLC